MTNREFIRWSSKTNMTNGECELMWKLEKIHMTIVFIAIGFAATLLFGCTYGTYNATGSYQNQHNDYECNSKDKR